MPVSPDKIRVSIIGTGRIGFSLEKDPLRYKPCTHMGVVQTLIKKGWPLKWEYLCDLDHERISDGKNFLNGNKNNPGTIRTTADYREVLASKPNILIIATNTGTHREITTAAIKAGVPRIVLEKPITLTYKEALAIQKQANTFKTHIWINYERRYHQKYIQLKKDIESGKAYGAPRYYRGWFASSNTSLFKKNQENEGALLHDTTHLVDLALFLFGDVKKFQRNLPNQDSHLLTFSHDNGISGELLTTINNRFFHFEMEIIFEHARVKVGNGFTIVEKLEKSKLYKNFTSLGLPLVITDKKMQVKDNPFMNLYLKVFHDDYETSFLKDACQNIQYLT